MAISTNDLNKENQLCLMRLEQESVLCQRIFMPANVRNYEAYAVASNECYEYARIAKEEDEMCMFGLFFNKNAHEMKEILVYRTGFQYGTNLEDEDGRAASIYERVVGKIVPHWSFTKGRWVEVYVTKRVVRKIIKTTTAKTEEAAADESDTLKGQPEEFAFSLTYKIEAKSKK